MYMGENSKGDMREMRGQALGECAGGGEKVGRVCGVRGVGCCKSLHCPHTHMLVLQGGLYRGNICPYVSPFVLGVFAIVSSTVWLLHVPSALILYIIHTYMHTYSYIELLAGINFFNEF